MFQIFEQTTIKDLREKSLLLTGYLELLIKQNFSQTPEGEQFNAKRPCMPDRGLSIKVTGFAKKILCMHLNFEANLKLCNLVAELDYQGTYVRKIAAK